MKLTISTCCLATLFACMPVASVSGQGFSPQATPPSAQSQQTPAQNGQAEAAQPTKENAIAVVNGDVITKQEFQVRLKPHLEANPNVDQQTKQVLGEQVMDGLIKERLVDQYLAETVPKPQEEEVEAVVGQVKQQVESQGTTYEQFLDSQGQTEEGMKQRIEGSISWQKFLQQQVSEEKLQQFFAQNQNHFEGKEYQEARPQVMQAYSMQLWQEVAEQKRPEAEIEVIESPAAAAPQIQSTPQPGGQATPQAVPQGQPQ